MLCVAAMAVDDWAADPASKAAAGIVTTNTPGAAWTALAETTAQTGVEMEALVAASVAALTVYDMAKAVDKDMEISSVRLLEKTKEPV